jgi:alkylation response protein AidB-like acyl-CoA dehydrogenase
MALDPSDLDMILASIAEFAVRELPDKLLIELDERDEFPADIVHRMCSAELGIQLLFVPEEYGGMGGSAFDVYRVCEQMAAIDLGVATSVLATFLGSDPIVVGGTPEQQQRWLGAIAEEGLLMAYGATEPEAGSDLGALKTVAVPEVDDDGAVTGYRITGKKQWISNGGVADLYTILALTPGGPTWFVVDRDTPGFSKGKPEDKHGIRLSNTAALFLDDVPVTPDRLVGTEEGQGLVQAQLVFGYTRLMVAAFGLGAGWAALDRAIPYSVERIQGGAPLSTKQGYTHKLIVPHAIRLEAARAYIEETAEGLDAHAGTLVTEGAVAKYLATEAGNLAADAAIQALGGYGYTHEYLVEKIKRDVRITTIYEGTSEIMEMTISRDRWQQHLKTRGGQMHGEAQALEALHARRPGVGADVAALAHHALADAMEWMRVGRLTRNQHVLLRLGAILAEVEGAAALCRRADREAAGQLDAKALTRLAGPALAAAARVNARNAALLVSTEAARLVRGAGGVPDDQLAAFAAAVRTAEITRAQAGLLDDLDLVADALYERETA